MKKVWTAVLAAMVLTAATVLAGCGKEQTFTAGQYSSAANEIQSMTVNVADRAVTMRASDDDKVHIGYFESEKEYYDITATDGALTMALTRDKKWTDFIGKKPAADYRTIDIKIPAGLTSLNVVTTNGTIRLSRVAADAIALDSNGGHVELDGVSVHSGLQVTAKNGNITGTVIGGRDDFTIICRIKKGESNLTDKTGGAKTLTADCNNGDIQVDFIAA